MAQMDLHLREIQEMEQNQVVEDNNERNHHERKRGRGKVNHSLPSDQQR